MEKSIRIKGITKFDYPVLYAALEKNMAAYNIKQIKVKIIDRREVNAFAISIWGDSIIVTKKALEKLNPEEIEAIVAHELSHIFNRDSILSLIIFFIFCLPFFGFFLLYIFFSINSKSITLGQSIIILVFLYISLYILSYGFKVLNFVSVLEEIRSDREAVLKTKNPEALKNALLKIYIEPFERNEKPSYYEKFKHSFEYIKLYFFGSTHPVSKERLEYLELAKEMLTTQKTWDNYK